MLFRTVDSVYVTRSDMARLDQRPITLLLQAWNEGRSGALDDLIPHVYAELMATARRHMRRERPEHTLQPTALVNEAFLRLVDGTQVQWRDRAHFLAVASRVMRRILVDLARARAVQKRGGKRHRITLDERLAVAAPPSLDVLALDEALSRLADLDVRRSQVTELRIFGGLTIEETAAALDVSTDTVTRDWKLAKAWLGRELARAV